MESVNPATGVVRRYLAATNAGDRATIADCLAENATFTIWGDLPISGTVAGKSAIMAEFLPQARQLFRSLQQHVTTIVTEGEIVVTEIHARGETAHGAEYRNSYCIVFETKNGLITAIREYMDTAQAKRVLG